jgi:O-antigen ligase
MDNRTRQLAISTGLVVLTISALLLAHASPGYFNNETSLGGLIFLQLLLAAVWKFRAAFFAFLMMAFLWAGVDLPLADAWTSARWLVLAAGAIIGYVLFMHDRGRRFHALHLVGLFCVAAAFVSALVSTYPTTAVLKAMSLALLFLYAGAGGRLAIHGREPSFFRGLLLACELITGFTAVAYFLLHVEIWGNPNSLGLVMGIGIAPLLLWGILIAETRPLRWRRSASFYLSIILLFYSLSRASIIAGIGSIAIACIVLRKQKLLLNGAMLALFAIAVTAILFPAKLASLTDMSTSDIVYKGHREKGILGSRKSPWQQTVDVISEHPWFGSGFGTSPSGREDNGEGMYSSNTDTSREHGSSYLAILEWVGLVGIVPFAALLLLLLWKTGQALSWMFRTRMSNHPMVPIVLIMVGGFIHAAFEDWLFAVGYYFTVFFWTLAFVLFDLAPARVSMEARSPEYFRAGGFEPLTSVASQVQP